MCSVFCKIYLDLLYTLHYTLYSYTLYCEFPASFGNAPFKHPAAVMGFHSLQKPVLAGPFCFFRLPSSFRHDSLIMSKIDKIGKGQLKAVITFA